MQIEEIISKNVEDIENLIPKIDKKIRKRRKRTLIITASIASIVFSFFSYKLVLVPQYEAFQQRKQQIEVADKLFKDYRIELTSISNYIIVDSGRYDRLIAIKKALPDLEKRYKPLGVKRDFTPLEDRINNSERIYHAELERKSQIALLDKELDEYRSTFGGIVADGIDEKELPLLLSLLSNLENLKEKYVLLNASGSKIRSIDELELKTKFEKEKSRYLSLAKGGFSISEEESLEHMLPSMQNLRTSYIQKGLEIKSLDDLIEDIKKAMKVVKVKKYDKQKVDYYASELEQLDEYVKSGKYNLVHKKIKNLAYKLKKEKFPSAEIVSNKLEDYSYFKLVKVGAQYGRKKVSGGYYKKKWVSPEYKTEKIVSGGGVIKEGLKLAIDFLTMGNSDLSNYHEAKRNIIKNKRVKVSEGYYKDVWVSEPRYERVLTQKAHYQKLQIFPSSGKQIVVNDFIPIKK